jgi:polyhydroxybutyrate depolymerase
MRVRVMGVGRQSRRSILLLVSALVLFIWVPERISAGMVAHDLQFEGETRHYFVYVPSAYDGTMSVPVVVGLHGYTSTATGFATAHGLDQHAERHGYIAVFPQGSSFTVADRDDHSSATQLITSWNDMAANLADDAGAAHCTSGSFRYPCPPTCESCSRCMWTSCGDDLGYLSQVLTEIKAQYRTDPTRYYLLGVSNGAMMALRWACDRSDEFAAVASIIGQLAPGFACQPSTQLPLLHITGALDDVVREDGQPASDGFMYETAERTQSFWAEALGCRHRGVWQPEDTRAENLRCRAWTECEVPSHEVVGCSDPLGTHQWPGAHVGDMSAVCVTSMQRALFPEQPQCVSISDTEDEAWGVDLVWSFFSRYSLREETRSAAVLQER